jgi:hypothetical protein
MMEYESEGIMAETLTYTDNHLLLVKNNRIFRCAVAEFCLFRICLWLNQ